MNQDCLLQELRDRLFPPAIPDPKIAIANRQSFAGETDDPFDFAEGLVRGLKDDQIASFQSFKIGRLSAAQSSSRHQPPRPILHTIDTVRERLRVQRFICQINRIYL